MTDWTHTGNIQYKLFKHPPQYALDIIKRGNNIIMPGGLNEYLELKTKLKENLLSRNDLLHCSSKVYETIKLLNS